MTSAFDIFDATIVPGFAEQLNAWGADLETTIRNFSQNTEAAHNEQKVTLEAIVYDLRSAFLAHTAELENLKNAVVMLEMRAGQLEQYSGKAVVELDAIMAAFRAELVQSRGDRAADGEALKGELRQLVAAVQAKFLELEGAIGPLTATAAAAAAQGPSRQDPWFQPRAASAGQPAPRGPVRFAMDELDGAQPGEPPGFARPPGAPPPEEFRANAPAGQPAGQPTWSSQSPAFAQQEYQRPPYHSQTEFRVDLRNWKGTLLDQRAKPDSYLAWHDRALGALSGNRPDVRRLLLWAEQQETPLDAAAELRGARAVALVYDEVASVSLSLFEGTKALLADSLLDTARTCGDGRGLELWRRLAAQWRGNAPQVLAAKSRRYFDPQRCSTAAKLWDALPPWEQLGSEIALGLPPGEALPDLLRAQALEKLVPEALLQVIWGLSSPPTHPSSNGSNLRWSTLTAWRRPTTPLAPRRHYRRSTRRAPRAAQTPPAHPK